MKNVLPVFILAALFPVLAGCATHGAGGERPRIHWLSLEKGLAVSAATGRPCLVDFFAGPDCPRCRALMDHVYSDPGVVARVEREFVPVRIDLTSPLNELEAGLAGRMETGGECMLLFLDRRGRVIRRGEDASPICTMDAPGRAEFIAILDAVEAAASP